MIVVLLRVKIEESMTVLLLFYAKIAGKVTELLFVVSVWCAFKLVAVTKCMISIYIVGLQVFLYVYTYPNTFTFLEYIHRIYFTLKWLR